MSYLSSKLFHTLSTFYIQGFIPNQFNFLNVQKVDFQKRKKKVMLSMVSSHIFNFWIPKKDFSITHGVLHLRQQFDVLIPQ